MKQRSIGRDNAIGLAATNWWKDLSPKEVAMFQLSTQELAMPFGDFQATLELALGRPVFTHELGLNLDRLWLELIGEADPPSFEDILNLIPAEKRIILVV